MPGRMSKPIIGTDMASHRGIAYGVIGAGVLFVWSATQHKSLLSTIQDLIRGKQPTPGPPEGSASSPAGSAASTTSLGGPGFHGSVTTVPEQNWIKAFLATLGAPLTQANINSISAWINHEGTYGTQGPNNPLNTTESGYGGSNWYGNVKGYPTTAQGILAEVATLLNGGYADIVSALRSGRGLCGQSFAGLSNWSGGGYSSVC